MAVLGLVFVVLACNRESSTDQSALNEVDTDSVMEWLQKSRDRKLSKSERILLINKSIYYVRSRKSDATKLKYLSVLSRAYRGVGDTVNFKSSNLEFRDLAKELNDSIEIANSFWDLGYFYANIPLRDSSFYYYNQAKKIFEVLGEDLYEGRMLYNMAVQQQKVKDYIASEITTLRAIKKLKPLDDKKRLFLSYNNLGTIYKELGDYEKSLNNYNTARDYALALPDENDRNENLRVINNNLGNFYSDQGDYTQAIKYLEAALSKDSLMYAQPRDYARTLNNLASTRLKAGDTTGVLAQLNKSLNIRLNNHDYEGASINYYSLANYYLQNGDSTKAIEQSEKALAMAHQSSNHKRELETLVLLDQLDTEGLNNYAEQYAELTEQLYKEERLVQDKIYRIQTETDEVIAENEVLLKQQQIILGVGLGVVLLGLATLIIFIQRSRVQKLRFQQQQQESNQEIFNLMLAQKQKMQEGKTTEQKRISEELHDGVLGELNGIRMVLLGLNKKNDEGAVDMRQQAIEKLQQIQEEIRTISHELNHAAYEKFHNFINSIKDLLQDTEKSSGIKTEFVYDEGMEWDNLSGDIKINLYRIIQESLQNCVKHADASKVKLQFDSWDSMLKVSLTDNGKGFDRKRSKKGIGHKNIKSRVEKLNGTWNLRSKVGKGTSINVLLPYTLIQTEGTLILDEEGRLQEVKSS